MEISAQPLARCTESFHWLIHIEWKHPGFRRLRDSWKSFQDGTMAVFLSWKAVNTSRGQHQSSPLHLTGSSWPDSTSCQRDQGCPRHIASETCHLFFWQGWGEDTNTPNVTFSKALKEDRPATLRAAQTGFSLCLTWSDDITWTNDLRTGFFFFVFDVFFGTVATFPCWKDRVQLGQHLWNPTFFGFFVKHQNVGNVASHEVNVHIWTKKLN